MSDDLSMLEAQQTIHELIAQQAPLERTLDAVAHWIEILLPGGVVAFMRLDRRRCSLSLFPTQHFSPRYIERLQQVAIGPDVASFGAAAHFRQLIVTEDIQTDPRWKPFRDVALREKLRACWSSPIITVQGELLGTFGIYCRQPATPSNLSKHRLRQAAALIALAILRDRDRHSHRTLTERHRTLFVNHPDAVYKLDLEGRILRGNEALERITGYPVNTLIGRHFSELVDFSAQALTQGAFDAAKAGASHYYEALGAHRAGHTYHLEATKFPVIVDGAIAGVYGVCRDITQRKRQEAEFRLLQRGIEATPSGVVMVAASHDMPIIYTNEAFSRLTGYSREEVLGKNSRFLQGAKTDSEALDTIRQALAEHREIQVTLLNYRKDSTPFWNQLSISPVFDSSGRCTHYLGIQVDITQQRSQEAQLAHHATHDLLTDLPNRNLLDKRLESAFRQSRQSRHLLALLYIDLDGFKSLNDGLGYVVGNRLLIVMAERLRQQLGPEDSVARLGGDEFAFLLPGLTSSQEAVAVAERILVALEQPLEIAGQLLYISASIGIACSDESVEQARELIQHAHLALEAAKQQGRNTWQWYQGDAKQQVNEHVLLRFDFHAALHENQFELYYQPIVEAASGRICSLEALVRWHHPRYGMVSPSIFIPLAEQTGQIIPLGRWVLRQACQDLVAMQVSGQRVFPVAVNISALQFRRDGFFADILRILDDTGLPPEMLELELTESVLLGGAEQAIEQIRALHKLGITVSMDDFGTGFSSLSYLRDLPIRKVKLDRAFIYDILTSRKSVAIVQGIIAMAHHLGLVVVAEGVEERAQQEDLIQRRCDLLQGFHFARPMPLKEVAKLPDVLPGA